MRCTSFILLGHSREAESSILIVLLVLEGISQLTVVLASLSDVRFLHEPSASRRGG